MKLSRWLFIIVLISSCNAVKNGVGNFKCDSNIQQKITLNANHTFVFTFDFDLCPSTIKGGTWTRKGRYIDLTYIGDPFAYFKKDTALYGADGTGKPIIRVSQNGFMPMDSLEIKINDAEQIYFTNRGGSLGFKKKMDLDSIRIKPSPFFNKWVTFKIPKGYNEVMVYLYNSFFQPCGYFYIPSRLHVKRNKTIEDEAGNIFARF